MDYDISFLKNQAHCFVDCGNKSDSCQCWILMPALHTKRISKRTLYLLNKFVLAVILTLKTPEAEAGGYRVTSLRST